MTSPWLDECVPSGIGSPNLIYPTFGRFMAIPFPRCKSPLDWLWGIPNPVAKSHSPCSLVLLPLPGDEIIFCSAVIHTAAVSLSLGLATRCQSVWAILVAPCKTWQVRICNFHNVVQVIRGVTLTFSACSMSLWHCMSRSTFTQHPPQLTWGGIYSSIKREIITSLWQHSSKQLRKHSTFFRGSLHFPCFRGLFFLPVLPETRVL